MSAGIVWQLGEPPLDADAPDGVYTISIGSGSSATVYHVYKSGETQNVMLVDDSSE